MTSTSSPTPAPRCGNAVLDPGEQCDDGNDADGDLCPSGAVGACRFTQSELLIHGHPRLRRVRQRGCWLGWYVATANALATRRGAPLPQQRCTDQDPGCDLDPALGRCEFAIVACLNVGVGESSQCRIRGVDGITIASPGHRGRAADSRRNRVALEHAFQALLDPGDPTSGHVHALPLTPAQRDYCTAPIPIQIELGALRRRSETLRVYGRDGDERGLRLDSRLRLTCER